MYVSIYKYDQVFSVNDCNKLHISEDLEILTLSFETFLWEIKCSWNNGFLLLDSKWSDFVQEANIRVGDTCVFLGTMTTGTYKVAILQDKLIKNYCTLRGKFYYSTICYYSLQIFHTNM